jgi:tetratricopeptide (TPR) repeat protein
MNRALLVALRQTPFLNLLASDKVGGTLKALKHSSNDKLTPELARDVCLRTNSRAVIAGAISDAGNGYRIGLTATNCQTGKVMAVSELDAASREQVVKTLGSAAAELRRKLGEPEASLREFNKPLDEASSPSLEALQEVTLASNLKRQHGDAAAAAAHLKRAVELDPNYAQAYVALGIGYFNAGDTKLSAQNLAKAYELRERVTQRDRFQIEAFYYIGITGQYDKGIQTLTEAVRTYPSDSIAHMNLSADLMAVGQYEQAVREAQESIRLTPSGAAYVDLMTSYQALGRLDAAKATFDEAQANQVDDAILYVQRYLLGFQQGDEAAMQEQLTRAEGKPVLLCAESNTQAFHGRARKSGELLQQATGHGASPQAAAECKALHAVLQAEIGNFNLSRRAAAEAQVLNPSANVRTSSALALARSGNLAEAGKLVQELSQEYPQATMMQDYSLPTIRAAIELEKNNPGEAIEILKVALPYELGFGAFSSLYPAYIRGEAYLKAGQGQLAAAEFQKLIDHPGIVSNFVTGALVHLQLGRAQAMAGDNDASRKSYAEFLALWKDADPDIPIYKQAKAEYARLP